jgi:hypothetical protein
LIKTRRLVRRWQAFGRGAVGLAIVSTGAFIAYTSMRANAWFGYSLTPDPVAGEVYARLSVAAEIIACLIPTGIRFYWTGGEAWTAVRGWALMAVALVVVFFAAGGFAITNITSGVGPGRTPDLRRRPGRAEARHPVEVPGCRMPQTWP